MTHFVFGGAGFTGRYLVESLAAEGSSVVICDIASPDFPLPAGVRFVALDVTRAGDFETLRASEDDVTYNLAARQFHNAVPITNQDAWFDEVNVAGTANILAWMARHGLTRLVALSTDMVYGFPERLPVGPDHPRHPLGPYGRSKAKSEDLCVKARRQGMQVTIMRPRMIVGPGRLGVLVKLFKLIERSLPVPLIGNGRNHYQMISVHDVVSAIRCAERKDFPNTTLNLGSDNPPQVRELLGNTIKQAGSRSVLVPTPAKPLKFVLATLERLGKPLLHREQYSIADINYLVDIEPTKRELDWQPAYSDSDMLVEAFRLYQNRKPHG